MHRPFAALLAAAALAACNGDGGTSVERLTAAEVAGVYHVCTLRFAPSNAALPPADLLTSVVDTTPPAGRPAFTIALTPAGIYDVLYTRNDAVGQQLRGSLSFGQTTVTLNFASQDSEVTQELLLPRPLTLQFTAAGAGAARLQAGGGIPYPVARANYASAAGISQEGLQPTINGSLTAVLVDGGC